MLALNNTQTETAEKVGVSAMTVAKWMKLPHFQDCLATYRSQMFERLMGQTIEEVMADTPNTFKRLRSLRDQLVNLPVALGACRELFARQIPARTSHQEEHTIRIVLEKKDETHARKVLEEDATFRHIEDAEVIDAPTPTA